ncbi:MAG: hypothetical protein OSA99_07600 [Acidimicrobiales bacterium]|nr:hypothetical protein [Acidimicrobiales bacterium]
MDPEISQRDLRLRSKEIMDAVESGQAFTVTRGRYPIAQLIPLLAGRRFVSRHRFAAGSATAPDVDLARFRSDQAAGFDVVDDDPYDR